VNADDLAGLLATTPAADTSLPTLGLHIGEVRAWNPATGENTIALAGTEVTDLPMLNIGDTTNLAVGDTVVVLRSKSAYFIFGRVVTPNSQAFNSTGVSFFSGFDSTDNYALTTTETIRATVTVPVPAWANRALVTAMVNVMAHNATGGASSIYGAPWIDVLNGPQSVQGVANGTTGGCSSSYSRQVAVFPGGSFDVTGRTNSISGTWAANVLNRTHLNVAVIFTKV
jgi:hypothetical protein